jgi:hypothetical protein
MNSNKKTLFTAEYQAVRIALPNKHAKRNGTSRLTPQSVMCVASCVASGGTTQREIAVHLHVRPSFCMLPLQSHKTI